MAHHYRELLDASRLLLTRNPGQRGRLPSARIRRSVSTAYYALFHFIQDECGWRLVGSASLVLRRRRLLARVLSHGGVKLALRKVAGPVPAPDVADFLAPRGVGAPTPAFAQDFAAKFIEAQLQRHTADYDLNTPISEFDARVLLDDAERVIDGWIAARSDGERDFKHALCLLVLLRGRFRVEDV